MALHLAGLLLLPLSPGYSKAAAATPIDAGVEAAIQAALEKNVTWSKVSL